MNSKKVIDNFMWRFLERLLAQIVNLVVTFILARLLLPKEYGTVAIVTVLLSLLEIFVDSGLGTALIQKKEVDDIDYSSVFFFNVGISIIIYICLFFLAPVIADIYNNFDLILILRIMGLSLFITCLKNIQVSYVSKNMVFKKFFLSTLAGTIIAAIVGIVLAYNGFGVWALISQYIINLIIDTTILWITVKWKPKLIFSFSKIKQLVSFGWKIFLSRLSKNACSSARQLIVGKRYSSSDLAYYNKGTEMPATIIPLISTSINNVLLPTMSMVQDERKQVLEILRKTVRLVSFCIWPIAIGLIVCGQSLINLLLSEKWAFAYPFLVISCLGYSIWPITAVYNNAIQAIGKSDVFLGVQITVRICEIALLIFSVFVGVYAIALSAVATWLFELLLSACFCRKYFLYGFKSQLYDIFPSAIAAIAMGICVYLFTLLDIGDLALIVIQVPCGIIIYLCLTKFFQFESLDTILNYIKFKWRKK